MSRSLKVDFDENGHPILRSADQVGGFEATCQNAIINLLVEAGSDPVFSSRGTDLLLRGLSGRINNYRQAEHAANFAASDTLFFGREHDTGDASDKMRQIELTPVLTSATDNLTLEAAFLSVGGVNLSYRITTP